MRLIPLRNRRKEVVGEAIVNDDDYERVSLKRWCLCGGYAARTRGRVNGKLRLIRMHREIMGDPPEGMVTDHINGNPLDNRRSNLRFCTQQQNTWNRVKFRTHRNEHVGIYWEKLISQWRSYIRVNGKLIHLGCFHNKDDAIASRLSAELKYFGEFSRAAISDPKQPVKDSLTSLGD